MYCKPCHNRITHADREAHGGARNYHLRRRYGITAEHAEQMLTEQHGLCAICMEAPAVRVDHDHATGRVRGLLCFNCNGALGQFRDRADLMARGALYLGLGSAAVSEHASFDSAFSGVAAESPRPEGEDNSYLFQFLDDLDTEVEPV